jgi:hypothetical protein
MTWAVSSDTERAVRVELLHRESKTQLRPPRTLAKSEWPPNYDEVLVWRRAQLARYEVDPEFLNNAKRFYAKGVKGCIAFINHWCDTFDTRETGFGAVSKGKSEGAWMPFILFTRQDELVQFILECIEDNEAGLVEKCRTMGASWVCVAISVWLWLFHPGTSIGWGSQKAENVDEIGNPKSIFWKIRELIKRLPKCFVPQNLNDSDIKQMLCHNPENESTIAGEVGDNIGRGGRTRVAFKDEAQPLTAKVLTPVGWKFMAEMVVGQLVIGGDGRATKVTQIKDCGVYDTYRVTFGDGALTECSPGHLWQIEEKRSGRWVERVVPTHELAGLVGNKKCRIPVATTPVEFEGSELPLDPYVVGVLLGDGCVSRVGEKPGSSPRISSADVELIKEVERLLPAYCVITHRPPYSYCLTDPSGYKGWGWNGSRVRQLVIDSGIAGLNSYTKFVPDVYKYASVATRLSLLQGLMDTDGSACSGQAHFVSASKRLAEDVRFIIESLGGTATFRFRPSKKGVGTYIVCAALPPHIMPFRLRRKVSAVHPRKHHLSRTVVSVEVLDRRPVRCISVAAPDGLYLTDHCIVTHNSAHYAHPELIEAALSENTKVPIDISSVNGLGNLFHRKREAGIDWQPGKKIETGYIRVFVMDSSDHPEYDDAWRARKRAYYERQGTLDLRAGDRAQLLGLRARHHYCQVVARCVC